MTDPTITAIGRRFAGEGADHAMEVAHDDGPYRHLRFRHQGPNYSGWYWFDLITVPGTLIFQGDGTSYVFSRVEDMFEFFRSPPGRINPHYWAEKLTSRHGEDAKTYDEAIFRNQVDEAVVDAMADGSLPGLADAVRDGLDRAPSYFESGAREWLASFAFYLNDEDKWDPDKQPDFHFTDTFGWDLRDYDWWFLWACHAIVWGIAVYDAHKAGRDRPTFPVQPATTETSPPLEPAKPARSMVTVHLPGDGA